MLHGVPQLDLETPATGPIAQRLMPTTLLVRVSLSIGKYTKLGAAGLRCNQATCALVCKPGYVSKGRRRVRCRKNKKKNQWFWKSTLGSCKTCDVETPTSNDPLMTTTCKVNEGKQIKFSKCKVIYKVKFTFIKIQQNIDRLKLGTNRKFCKLSCPADHTAADSKAPFVKITCKCPRGSGDCGWYNRYAEIY